MSDFLYFCKLVWKKTGVLMTSTATVIERPQPYHLALELARGKVNQVRGQAADWLQGGLQVPVSLTRLRR